MLLNISEMKYIVKKIKESGYSVQGFLDKKLDGMKYSKFHNKVKKRKFTLDEGNKIIKALGCTIDDLG